MSTAIANQFLNNPNEIGPDGTKTTEVTGYQSTTDPYTGKTYKIPTSTVTTSLSEAQQAIKDQQDGASLNLSTLANNQSGFLNDYMTEPFQYNTGDHEKWAMGLYDQVNGDRIGNQSEALRTRLANQGIKAGSEAYAREMESFQGGNQNASNQFLLDSYGTGMQTALANRNQPINEITALMSGGQVSQPSFMTGFQGSQIPTTDNASIIGNYDKAKAAQAQANGSIWGSALGGIGGLFAGF